MAKAKQLPSGQWRTLVYNFTDSAGKRHYESFTAATKAESEFLAAQFALSKSKSSSPSDMTVEDAVKDFLASRSKVLSPVTLREYTRMGDKNLTEIARCKISRLDNATLQRWVNSLAADLSPKSVKNNYGFLSTVLRTYLPDANFRVRLPAAIKYDAVVPTNDDISKLIAWHKENDTDMLYASLLAAFGSLRRSEISPLEACDVKQNCILVHRAMVYGIDGWTVKNSNKNSTSHRIVPMPESVIQILPKSGNLVNLNPDQITNHHEKAISKLEIPSFRFHDLRHYTASVMHAIGIPDQYIMERGGWATDHTLKSVYRGTIDDYSNAFTQKALKHFDQVFADATQDATQKRKTP